MKTKLIIRFNASDIDFALLRDDRLVALNKEKIEPKITVGDIYLAKVGKVLSGLNAAFVDVGCKKDGFLHYHDLGAQLKSLTSFSSGIRKGKIKDYRLKNFKPEADIDKNGSISGTLKTGQQILVQIAKESISTKGPRITSELAIAGRYLVLVPFSDRVSISQKIEDSAEKSRLKKLIRSIKPKGFGVIIRTVANNRKVAELDADLQNSLEKWSTMWKKYRSVKTSDRLPIKIMSEMNRASSILRDMFDDTFTDIVTNDESLSIEIKEYLEEIAPDKESIIKHYNSSVPIFEKFGIERQIKTSFGETVSMPKGAYLVIEHTEALHVIDVNSGNRSNKTSSQEATALEVNMIAAAEVARQLQLRDMGGIIVVDFIDMQNYEHRKQLYEYLVEQMSYDRTKHKILPPSKFGLIQITRQRTRPELVIKTKEKNPNTNNEVEPPIILIDRIENEMDRLLAKNSKTKLTLNIHPFIASYLTKGGMFSIRFKWFLKLKKWISVLPRDSYKYLEYNFTDKEGNKISP